MSGEYGYYEDGFFGFGPPGTFRPYTLMHLMPILVCVILLIVVWHKREWLRQWKREGTLRYVLSFLMFVMEFGFYIRLLYVGDTSGKYLMMARIPIQVCDLGIITCMYMITSKNQSLFGINFFVTLFGATLACIIPQAVLTEANPTHFRYYQYFGDHLLPIFSTVYMIIVHRMRPRYKDIWISVSALAVLLILGLKLNDAYPGASYLFLKLSIPFFPDNQYLRALIYSIGIIIVFHLMWLLWNRFLQYLSRRKAA